MFGRYSWLWIVPAAGLVLVFCPGNSFAQAETISAPGRKGIDGKTSRTRSVLHFSGYDIVLTNREYVPVRMDALFEMKSLLADKRTEYRVLERAASVFERYAHVESMALGPVPPIINRPPRAGNEKDDTWSFHDDAEVSSGHDVEMGGLSRWGWLADKVFAQELAATEADGSISTIDADMPWEYDLWQTFELDLWVESESVKSKTPESGVGVVLPGEWSPDLPGANNRRESPIHELKGRVSR